MEGRIEAESVAGIRVTVERVYAGTAERTITVLPGQWNARRVGVPWTFYLVRSPVAYHSSDCDGSHPNALTARERNVLGEGYPPPADDVALGSALNGLLLGGAAIALARITDRWYVARSLAMLTGGIAAGCLLAAPLLGRGAAFPLRDALVGGEWWTALFAVVAAASGGAAAVLLPRPVAVALAGIAPVLAILTLIAIKAARWPAFPAVGDGFAAIAVWFGLAGAATAVGVSAARGPAAQIIATLSAIPLSLAGVYAVTLLLGR